MIEVVLLLFRLSCYLGCPIIPVVLLLFCIVFGTSSFSDVPMNYALNALNKYWLLVNLAEVLNIAVLVALFCCEFVVNIEQI